jgi:hypothetical protein
MSDITQQAASAIVNVADDTMKSALEVLGTATDLAKEAVTAPIEVGGKAVEAVLEEVGELQEKAFKLLRQVVDAVTEPLP